MKITKDYLVGLSYDELCKLHMKYDNLSHNASRYDINLSIDFANEEDLIKEEIEKRDRINSDKPVIDSNKKRVK